MLYKVGQINGIFDSLEPVAFGNVPLEKHLEDLLAKSLLDVLFEGNELMPIFQERSLQPEADIYALDKRGDLVIFELKRDEVGEGAVHQVLRYCEKASRYTFEQLQQMLVTYTKGKASDLQEEHRNSFDLDRALDRSAFNTRQRLYVVGSASNEELIRNVDYWKSKGLLLDFIPYRIYTIGEDHYFEFFSLPYDRHSNPNDLKGVLFDTNRTYTPNSIWYMCDNDRVAAFGDQQHIVSYLGKGDIVFLYHKWEGVVAAGKIQAGVKVDVKEDAQFRDVEWLTSKPTQAVVPIPAMTAAQIKAVLHRNFFWARTIKTPYLSKTQAENLLAALIAQIGPKQ
jgi:hypothetical protein